MEEFKLDNPLILEGENRKVKYVEEFKDEDFVMIVFTDGSVAGMSKGQYERYFGGDMNDIKK